MSEEHNGIGTDIILFDQPTPFGTVGTDFLMYAVGGGANIEAQIDYQNDPQRSSGALPGVARSNFQNKATRQGTFVAHSLCLWMSQQLQLYIPDDGNDIAWIGSYTNALNQLILAAIPPGPNLGAYLPLIGGTMVGSIYFQPGISTILANNTWYYGKDTGGTNRGLIIKGSDNNIYINDGHAQYVHINGTPTLHNNNTYLSGIDTGNNVRPIIGLLSDNAIHIGDSAREIFLDTSGTHAVQASGNIIIPNTNSYFCKSADGVARAVMGMSNGNALMIGAAGQGTTDLYAASGSPINAHNQLQSLSTFVSYGYSYLTGGRAYIPGGNDPWQIYADAGYYARIRFVVGGTRDWSLGCLPGAGIFAIADESGAAVRLQIETNGNTTIFGALYANGVQVAGGLTVYNGLHLVTGRLNIDSGGATIGGGMTLYDGFSLVSGNFSMNGNAGIAGSLTVSGGAWIANSLNVTSGGFGCVGPGTFNGLLTLNGGCSVAAGNLAVAAGAFSVSGAATVGNHLDVYNGLTVQSGNLTAGYIRSYGSARVDGNFDVIGPTHLVGAVSTDNGAWIQGSLSAWGGFNLATGNLDVMAGSLHTAGNTDVGNTAFVRNQLQVWNYIICQTGDVNIPNGGVSAGGNLSFGGAGYIYNGLSVWNGLAVNTGNFNVNGAVGIGGGLTVYNGLNVQTGNGQISNGSFNVAGDLNVGNTGYVRNQLQCWNHLYVQSGDMHVQAGSMYASANMECGNTAFIHNQAQVWNWVVVKSGGVSIEDGNPLNSNGGFSFAGTGYIYNGLNVWNSLVVQSGRFTAAGDAYVNNGLSVYNGLWVHSDGWCDGNWSATGLYANYVQSNGNANLNGYCHVGQLQVGGLGYMYDRGDNFFIVPPNVNILGGLWVNANVNSGSINNGGDLHTNWVYTNALQDYGGAQINGGLTVFNGFTNHGNIYSDGEIRTPSGVYGLGLIADVFGVESIGSMWLKGPRYGQSSNYLQWTGNGGRGYSMAAISDWLYMGWNDNGGPPTTQQWLFVVNAGGIQLLVGNAYKPGGGAWADSSERRFKKDIEDYECGLDVLRQLRPRRYRFNGQDIGHPDDGRTYHGFVAEEIEDIMPELVHDYDRGCVHGVVKAVDITPMFYAMLNSIKELAARVEQLEGRKH